MVVCFPLDYDACFVAFPIVAVPGGDATVFDGNGDEWYEMTALGRLILI